MMAEAVGAATVDMDQIQLHPTVYQATSMLVSEKMRSLGAILVNQEGKRFCNDLSTRDAVSAAELQQTGGYAYIIFDQNLVDHNKSAQEYINKGMDDDPSTAPFYAIQIAPGIHHTMGGIKIDTDAEVISTDGSVIPGLFAAGETTGGVHGGNRIGGNAVCDFVVFGRIAGLNAADYAAALELAPAA